MKRISLFVIFLSLLFSSISIISAQGGLLTSFTTIVNFRAGPGVEWRVMATPPQGTTVLLDGQAYEGTWVRGIIPDGTVGWTLTEYVTISVEQALSLPVVYVETPFTLPAPPQQGEIVSAPQQPAEQASESQAAETAAPVSTGLTSGIGATATARLNMRYGPSTEYVVVDGIEIGGTLNVDGRSGNSLWIRGITTSGKVGWVFAEYTSLNIDQINALPVVGVDTPFSLGAPAGAPAAPAEAPPEQAEVPAAPPAAPIASTAPVSGFSYGGHVQGFSDASANWMRVAGMTWVKKQWRYVDGQDAGAAAGMIADAHNRGFRIMVGVIGVSPTDLNNGGYYDRFAGFVAGLAGLGADGIEIWNEPNIDREWPSGQISPAQYTQLLAQSYNAIKGVNPNTLVVSGAPAPTGFFGGCTGLGCDDDKFIAGMAAAGAGRYMDCIGIHYNEGIVPPSATSGDPRGNSGHYTRYLRSMMNVYSGAFGGRVPLCFTELGYLSPEGYGPLPGAFEWAANVTVAQQAAWLDGAINIARNSGRVRLVIIWNVDFQNYGADPMAGYAMIRPDGSCPACNALGS